tara:strand:- start:431 stop:544 length:114 start_codon:yes stop_codon:yes gene_type:complete
MEIDNNHETQILMVAVKMEEVVVVKMVAVKMVVMAEA